MLHKVDTTPTLESKARSFCCTLQPRDTPTASVEICQQLASWLHPHALAGKELTNESSRNSERRWNLRDPGSVLSSIHTISIFPLWCALPSHCKPAPCCRNCKKNLTIPISNMLLKVLQQLQSCRRATSSLLSVINTPKNAKLCRICKGQRHRPSKERVSVHIPPGELSAMINQ